MKIQNAVELQNFGREIEVQVNLREISPGEYVITFRDYEIKNYVSGALHLQHIQAYELPESRKHLMGY